MNPVVKELVNQKVRQLDLKELIRFSQKEGIPLTVKDAKKVLSILHAEPFDIGNKQQVEFIRKQLSKEFPDQYQKALVLLEPYEHYLS